MKMPWIAPLCLSIAACSGAADDAGNADAPVALVTLARVDRESLAPQTTVYGAAEPGPMGKLSLTAPVEAVVASIDAPVGTAVTRGQVVARLAASPTTRVDLTKAASDASAATAAFARAQRLRGDGLASNADVETAAAAAKSANALRASLSARSAGLTLRAPATGVVDTVGVTVGDLVQPGAAVASVSRAADPRVRFGVDAATARSLKPGMALTIAASAARPALTVSIQSVDPIADPQTRLYAVFATIPAGSGIAIGEALTAAIGTRAATSSPSIPYAALLDDAGQPFVYVVAGGVAHRHDIVLGPTGGDRIAVTRGVKPGDSIVVEGGTALEDGMKVRTK